MNVLLFSSSYPPRTGGVELVTHRLARGLAGRGHRVTVATNRHPRALSRLELVDGIPVHRQLYPAVPPILNLRPGSARAMLRAIALLPLAPLAFARLFLLARQVRPDVVNIHYWSYPSIYMAAVACLLRIPLVISFHGSDVPSVPYPAGARWLPRWTRRRLRACTACSRDLRTSLLQSLAGAESVEVGVAYSGVDVGEPEQRSESDSPPEDRAALLVIARLVPKKGVQTAVEATALLSEAAQPPVLEVIGDGPERKALERLAGERGVADLVTFHGGLPPEVVQRHIRNARVVLVPSLWEAFGIVCLEAMAAGKPVVASRTGGIPEIVADGETGLLVPPGDPERLAAAVQYLLANPCFARELGQAGQRRVLDRFTWDGMLDQYLEAYATALRESGRVAPAQA